MNTTTFALARAAARVVASAALAAAALAAPLAHALDVRPYAADALAAAQSAGKPVAVHFHADWCPTCKQQDKAIAQLKAEPALDGVTLLVADYDQEKDLKKAMKVRTQSTLVVFRGAAETGRLAGETSPDKLRDVLKTALAPKAP